ncbi:M23 family metallopeptidase [Novosphingobium sp.]|uniref:M23 family metallopeptidase n=1 Tax=Novosphingobium sp. TaxID=1874826 RepID=UPI003342B1F3
MASTSAQNSLRDGTVDSYDPRVWAQQWSPRPVSARRLDRIGPVQRSGLAIGAAIGILGLGALAAISMRPALSGAGAAGGIGPLAQATPAEPAEVRHTLILTRAADLAGMLTGHGVDADTARRVTDSALPALKPDGQVRAVLVFRHDGDKLAFVRLEASNGDSSGVVVRRGADGALATARVAAQVSVRSFVVHGTMDGDSFYTSAVAVGMPNSLISVFARALSFDFNFQTEVSAGDAFEAAYTQPVNASGEVVGVPVLLYASLTTATKSAAVYRFDQNGQEAWFDASGRSTVHSLMRTPVDGARITSKFGMRFHPVLHFMKLHGGIDFAAPIGTPIYASGEALIEFAGPKGPNGNFVKLKHTNGWETLYLHMNRFADGIVEGGHVNQGQQIGEIGTTGRSTGPHLHYEVHINGEQVDPLEVPTDNNATKSLDSKDLLAFEAVRDRVDVSRAQQSQ